MTKEEYRKFLDDTETSLAVIKASRSKLSTEEAMQMLSLGLEIAKEKYRLDCNSPKEWWEKDIHITTMENKEDNGER